VLFIRQREATAIVEKAEAVIRGHADYKRPGPPTADRQLRRNYVLHQTGDPNREIHMALLPVVIRSPKGDNRKHPEDPRGTAMTSAFEGTTVHDDLPRSVRRPPICEHTGQL
jgi:hypothetical protein